MEISELPDAELLEVLGRLDVSDLLLSRGVCRRWLTLALHPSLWRSKDVCLKGDNIRDSKIFAAALRAAPCARSMELCIGSRSRPFCDVWHDEVRSTRCAVSRLLIECSAQDALLMKQALSRQSSLGRLKEVFFTLFDSTEDAQYVRWIGALLLELVQTKGLDYVDVGLGGMELPPPAAPAPVPPSLRRLELLRELNGYTELLLKWHAASLEDVYTQSRRVAPLLAAMPRLRKLTCRLQSDMQALLQCSALRSLTIDDGMVEPGRVGPETVAYLRAAVTRLEKLALIFHSDFAGVADLVLSLRGTDTTPAALRRLDLYVGPALRPLASVLHRLPLLTILRIDDGPWDGLLDAMDGKAVPKLEELWLEPGCVAEVVHSEGVRRVMRRYPRLHVGMWPSYRHENCRYCEEHPDHQINERGSVMLCSHPKGLCGVPTTHEQAGVLIVI